MEAPKLLIIDTRENCQRYEKIAGEEKFVATYSESSEQALALCGEHCFSIIILSLKLDSTGGLELCRNIRKTYFQRPLQIVVLSEDTDLSTVDKVIEAGGDDFIKLPVSDLELQLRLRAAWIRMKNQLSLFQEKEFFRQAAKQEEELSSRILDQNLHLKEAFRNIVSIKEDLERTNASLEQIAKYDMLSGLLNRMSLFAAMDIEIERSQRTGQPLCGIMIDVDFFKSINDNYGHQGGDSVIRHIGSTMKNSLRKYDHAGRYGGEEFFIILPNTQLALSLKIAARFKTQIQGIAVLIDDKLVPITLSMGIAKFRQDEGRDAWVARSDRAMYLAKQSGRDKICDESEL
jgi:diguanylate cyclase (GGDEF)-like protein